MRRLLRGFATLEERRRQLSCDLEFCCFSYAYAVPCATCPFPEGQRPEPDLEGSSLAGRDVELKLKHACSCLGLDHRRLDPNDRGGSEPISPEELKRAFRDIAFASHPDTATEAEAADAGTFRQAFTSYSLLREFLF